MVKKFVKKRIEVSAIQFKNDADTIKQVEEFMGDSFNGIELNGTMNIETLEGTMIASEGDYIIKGINGEFYPCKPDIFEKTYDSAETTFIERMEHEIIELKDRFYKINKFIISDKFNNLKHEIKTAMMMQAYAMEKYFYSLELRYRDVKDGVVAKINYQGFDTALHFMKIGYVVSRSSNTDVIYFMQVPADIEGMNVISKMTSLPDSVKEIINKSIDKKEIKYRNQFLSFNTVTNEATYFCPTTDDLCASDWFVL
jgi:hypothetical protein|nr:MAG TPA: PGDYG protein [Caudoviricetes sp.]